MPEIDSPLPESYLLVAAQPELDRILARAEAAERWAVDTEADSLHCYREKLCLIQLTIPPGEDYIVDPLTGLDLQPFLQAITQRCLVLHGADFDLRMLRRAGMPRPREVFDTMIGARLMGLRQFSLAALVEHFTGIVLQKGEQKADWGKRPLTGKMLEYAANDTRHLLEVAAKIEAELIRLGRLAWFEQSCSKVTSTVFDGDGESRKEDPWRIAGSGNLDPKSASILRELWTWRDGEASRLDRPAFHVMRNEVLLETVRQLSTGNTSSPRQMNGRHAGSFSEAASRAVSIPPEEWPRKRSGGRSRPTPEMEARFEQLRKIRDAIATDLNLETSVIASRTALEAIAQSPEAASTVLMPWQRELLAL